MRFLNQRQHPRGLILLMVAAACTNFASGGVWSYGQSSPEPGALPDSQAESLKPTKPLPPPGYLPACLELIKQKRYQEARQRLAPVVDDHAGWARAHFYLGLTYHKEHRYEKARPLFARALALDPDFHAMRVFYGWSLYYLGEPAPARRMFESYLAIEPGYPDAIFALGLIDFDDDNMTAAAARFGRAIELSQERQDRAMEAKSRARLADVHIRNDKLNAAKLELERSINLNPDNYEPYYKLYRVLLRLGEAEGARQALQQHDEVRERLRQKRRPGERRPVE